MKTNDNSLSYIIRQHINRAINLASIVRHFKKPISSAIQIWEGKSLFDDQPIQIVATGYGATQSNNSKTGPLIQVSILPVNGSPWDTYSEGLPTVCGNCKYNGQNGCYVRWSNLSAKSNCAKRQKGTLELGTELFNSMRVRIGESGDPAAVSYEVWEQLLQYSDSYTGYTHQWRYCDQRLKSLFMASCDNIREVLKAIDMGWKIFYVYTEEKDLIKLKRALTKKFGKMNSPRVIHCQTTNSNSLGMRIQCFDCMLCSKDGMGDYTIVCEKLHGATSTLSAAKNARGE